MATRLKARFRPRAQVVIFGLEDGQYTRRDAESMLGITVLRGDDAAECKGPSVVFADWEREPVFYG